MEYEQLIRQGGDLMLVGMGVVFAYLGFLVFLVWAVSHLARCIGSEEEKATASPAGGSTAISDDVPAVITAAVHQYRSDQNN